MTRFKVFPLFKVSVASLYSDVTDQHNLKGLFFLGAGLISWSAFFCYGESTEAPCVSAISRFDDCCVSDTVIARLPLPFYLSKWGRSSVATRFLGWLLLTRINHAKKKTPKRIFLTRFVEVCSV